MEIQQNSFFVNCLTMLKQVANSVKANQKFWRNNQIVTACRLKVYQCEMAMNEIDGYERKVGLI